MNPRAKGAKQGQTGLASERDPVTSKTNFADSLASLAQSGPGLLSDPAPHYLEEPRGYFKGQAIALARPRSTAEVALCITAARRNGVAVIPYAGGTGLVGGQVRPDGGPSLILSLERMNRIRELSATDQTMVAEAGCILADVQAAAEGEGLLFPLSLASEGTCRIGGNLATNAGGVNVLRYGNTRDLCLGLEAVMPDGTVLNSLKSLRKDNTGYDIRHLLIGSEGTLGVITAARLRLFPRPAERATGFLTVPDPLAALTLLRRLQGVFGETISAFELIDRTGVEFVRETLPDITIPPVDLARWHVLVELGSGPGLDLSRRFEEALATHMETGLVLDGTIAQSDSQRQTIWTLRESIPEANRLIGAIASHDISVPIGRVPEFIERGRAAINRINPAFRINSFGHLGDGNLHYNIYPPTGHQKAAYADIAAGVTRMVHDLVHDFDGSISAEHGIGRIKTADLARYGDPVKLAVMRQIKSALDPDGLMNPGVIFD